MERERRNTEVNWSEAEAPLDPPAASWTLMVRNFGWLTLGEAIARLLSFLAIILMTRRLSLGDFGIVALGGNLVVWFSLIVN